METTLPLVIFVLATTGLSIITLIGFVFSDWQATRQPLGSVGQRPALKKVSATARNDGHAAEALKAA